jgi:four helix bundle protein
MDGSGVHEKPKSFEAWKEMVHESIRNDPLWGFQVYPKALYAHDLAWADCEYLLKDVRGRQVTGQLVRSVGSISANIEEGYGRGYGKDYGYHMRIAIAEARESRGWYWKGRILLPTDVLEHRMRLLSEIIAMLASNLDRQKNFTPVK